MNSSLNARKPKICVSVAPRSLGEASALLGEASSSPADLVELRLDALKADADGLATLLRSHTKPLIITYSTDPSLTFGASLAPRQLEDLLPHADYVDIDLPIAFGGRPKRIKSIHLWRSISFEEGVELAEKAWSSGCDVVKIVFKAQSYADNFTALKLTSTLEMPNVVFCMGELGSVSRVLAPLCGSQWTYASLRGGTETAPGQIDVYTLRELYSVVLEANKA